MDKAKLNKLFTSRSFNLGDLVYLVTDPMQDIRLVTGILIQLNGSMLYQCAVSSSISSHYAGELTFTKNLILTAEE